MYFSALSPSPIPKAVCIDYEHCYPCDWRPHGLHAATPHAIAHNFADINVLRMSSRVQRVYLPGLPVTHRTWPDLPVSGSSGPGAAGQRLGCWPAGADYTPIVRNFGQHFWCKRTLSGINASTQHIFSHNWSASANFSECFPCRFGTRDGGAGFQGTHTLTFGHTFRHDCEVRL